MDYFGNLVNLWVSGKGTVKDHSATEDLINKLCLFTNIIDCYLSNLEVPEDPDRGCVMFLPKTMALVFFALRVRQFSSSYAATVLADSESKLVPMMV